MSFVFSFGVLSGLFDVAPVALPVDPAAASCLLLFDCFTTSATCPFLLGSNDNLGVCAGGVVGLANVEGITFPFFVTTLSDCFLSSFPKNVFAASVIPPAICPADCDKLDTSPCFLND